ncbi:MAG: PEP-CTERM sorting domain-containing protein [Candidatus Tectomicrobia bacterium]|uniref:PEP-CTERM sorting domain-containing protein n=1 Tax=Tectimicrobiota bacterium TaxID=2528274 RepID=A0A932CNG5_UNCTE|nr:PEP-CTERM sorting domain-containing protein [Candidatus Tectomicrobia bacterium]
MGGGIFAVFHGSVTVTPEPGTILLIGSGLAGLMWGRKRSGRRVRSRRP